MEQIKETSKYDMINILEDYTGKDLDNQTSIEDEFYEQYEIYDSDKLSRSINYDDYDDGGGDDMGGDVNTNNKINMQRDVLLIDKCETMVNKLEKQSKMLYSKIKDIDGVEASRLGINKNTNGSSDFIESTDQMKYFIKITQNNDKQTEITSGSINNIMEFLTNNCRIFCRHYYCSSWMFISFDKMIEFENMNAKDKCEYELPRPKYKDFTIGKVLFKTISLFYVYMWKILSIIKTAKETKPNSKIIDKINNRVICLFFGDLLYAMANTKAMSDLTDLKKLIVKITGSLLKMKDVVDFEKKLFDAPNDSNRCELIKSMYFNDKMKTLTTSTKNLTEKLVHFYVKTQYILCLAYRVIYEKDSPELIYICMDILFDINHSVIPVLFHKILKSKSLSSVINLSFPYESDVSSQFNIISFKKMCINQSFMKSSVIPKYKLFYALKNSYCELNTDEKLSNIYRSEFIHVFLMLIVSKNIINLKKDSDLKSFDDFSHYFYRYTKKKESILEKRMKFVLMIFNSIKEMLFSKDKHISKKCLEYIINGKLPENGDKTISSIELKLIGKKKDNLKLFDTIIFKCIRNALLFSFINLKLKRLSGKKIKWINEFLTPIDNILQYNAASNTDNPNDIINKEKNINIIQCSPSEFAIITPSLNTIDLQQIDSDSDDLDDVDELIDEYNRDSIDIEENEHVDDNKSDMIAEIHNAEDVIVLWAKSIIKMIEYQSNDSHNNNNSSGGGGGGSSSDTNGVSISSKRTINIKCKLNPVFLNDKIIAFLKSISEEPLSFKSTTKKNAKPKIKMNVKDKNIAKKNNKYYFNEIMEVVKK